MHAAVEPIIDAIGWGIVHSVWQVACVWLFNAIAQRLLRQASADVRYVIACLSAFVATAAAVGTTIAVSWGRSGWPLPVPGPKNLMDIFLLTRPTAIYESLVPVFKGVAPFLVALWTIWAATRFTFLIYAVNHLNVAARRLVHIDDSDAPAAWRSLRKSLTPNLNVRLAETNTAAGPATVGWLRPIVLVPIGFFAEMSPNAVEAILAHELAHVRRRDYLVNLLQAASETLLGFHPLMRSMHHQIRELRELCCDDMASTVADRRTYAEALLQVHDRKMMPQLAMGISGSPLFVRIARLLDVAPTGGWRYISRSIGACALLLFGLGFSGPNVASKLAFDTAVAAGYQRSMQEDVYRLLSPKDHNPHLVGAMVQAIERLRADTFDAGAAKALAEVVCAGGQPNTLLTAALPYCSARSRTPSRKLGWAGGNGIEWDRLCNLMYAEARKTSDRAAARSLTRACLLLSAQQRLHFGSEFQRFARQPDVASLADLSKSEGDQLRLIVSIDAERRGSTALIFQKWSKTSPREISEAVRTKVGVFPEGQWLIANYISTTRLNDPARAESLLNSVRAGNDLKLCLEFLSR